MRSTKDLIRELSEEAPRFNLIGIVVGFERETKYVFHRPQSDEELLAELNALVKAGGESIGLIGYLKTSEGSRFYRRPFEEYAGEQWVEDYLDALGEFVRQTAEQMGIRTLRIRPQEN